ncbi:MAG: hypothetical protein WC052_00800 [Patescibacteria group bacterium]
MFFHRYHWQYKNTTLLVASLVLLFLFIDTPAVTVFIQRLNSYGELGAFITGIFFVSTFTVAPAVIVLYNLLDVLQPLEVALFAGIGSVVGDYIIFRFFKDHILEELAPLFLRFGGTHFSRLMATPYFGWLAPVVGALVIASPLPDELGITLLGIARLRNWQFVVLSFIFNFAGIFAIVSLHELI